MRVVIMVATFLVFSAVSQVTCFRINISKYVTHPLLGARNNVTKTWTARAYKEVQDPRKPGYYQNTGGGQEEDKITFGGSHYKTAVAEEVSDGYNRFWSIRAGSVHQVWLLQAHGQWLHLPGGLRGAEQVSRSDEPASNCGCTVVVI